MTSREFLGSPRVPALGKSTLQLNGWGPAFCQASSFEDAGLTMKFFARHSPCERLLRGGQFDVTNVAHGSELLV